jgi:hypothetical protein
MAVSLAGASASPWARGRAREPHAACGPYGRADGRDEDEP